MALLLAVVAAGCGGAGAPSSKLVAGPGYTFSVPSSWAITTTSHQVRAAEGNGSLALVAVSRFPLVRAFAQARWPEVVAELDRAASQVASQQRGQVSRSDDMTIAGLGARRYDIDYTLRGKPLVETLGFVLRDKTEYLLLCRRERPKSNAACDLLLSSFRLG